MASRTKMLDELVERVSTKLGEGATTERLFAQETAFAALVRSAPKRYRRRRNLAASLAAAALACLLLWMLSGFSAEEMPFFVGGARAPGEVGRWEETREGGVSAFAFSQGSRIDLREKTMAKVKTADERRVQVTLRRGVIDTNIVGNGVTEWTVDAGPWRITVMGTHFTVDWREERDYLAVAVTRGKVRVERTDGTGRAVEVSGGERFLAVDGKRTVAPLEVSSSQAPPVGGGAASQENGSPSQGNRSLQEGEIAANESAKDASSEDRQAAKTSGPPARDDDAAPSKERDNRLGWLVHYANGSYDAALASASKYGIEELIEQLDAVRLWKLQDAARVTRRYDLSAKILLRFRARFPKDRNAEVAGFLLGRIAMDKRQFPTAARWFNTYIAEAPSGSLAEEAHGLLIIVYEKMGRAGMARQAATRYLNRYEGGAFAKIADAHVGDR
jgi:TolA-binding protein